jgi:hypothetical protein
MPRVAAAVRWPSVRNVGLVMARAINRRKIARITTAFLYKVAL